MTVEATLRELLVHAQRYGDKNPGPPGWKFEVENQEEGCCPVCFDYVSEGDRMLLGKGRRSDIDSRGPWVCGRSCKSKLRRRLDAFRDGEVTPAEAVRIASSLDKFQFSTVRDRHKTVTKELAEMGISKRGFMAAYNHIEIEPSNFRLVPDGFFFVPCGGSGIITIVEVNLSHEDNGRWDPFWFDVDCGEWFMALVSVDRNGRAEVTWSCLDRIFDSADVPAAALGKESKAPGYRKGQHLSWLRPPTCERR